MAIRMLGLFMILPIFAIFGADYLYANQILIGVAIGIYGLTQGLMQIPFGYLSDKFGRKPILIIGLLLFALGNFIATLDNNIYLVIIGRFIAGAGAIASVLIACVGDMVSSKNRVKAGFVIGAQIGIVFMISLILGPIIANAFGINGVFHSAVLLSLIAILLVITLPKTDTKKMYSLSLSNIKSVLNAKLLTFDFGVLVLHIVMTSLFVIIPQLLADNIASSYFVVFIFSIIFIMPLILITKKKRRHKNLLVTGLILIITSQLLLINYDNYYSLIVYLIVFFMGFNLLESLMPSMVLQDVDNHYAEKRGLVMGVYSTSQFFGAFIGGIMAGYMSYNFNINAVFIFNIIITGIWLIIITRRKYGWNK